MEQNEDYLDYIKNEKKKSVIEKILKIWIEAFFSNLFEDVRHERSPIILLSVTVPDILKQSKFTDHEINVIKNIAVEKLHRQRILKEYVAVSLIE